MRISDGVQTCALPISRIPAQRPVFLRDPRKADEDGMQRRSQEALTAMRQILRATENYARRLSRLTGLTASQQIGRAACRERVCQYVEISVVALSLKKKKPTNHTHTMNYFINTQ